MATNVVFRKFKSDGQIIALFPTIKATTHGADIMSYMTVGQHGAASPYASSDTVLATETEYQGLLNELRSVGYDDLAVQTRIVRSYK